MNYTGTNNETMQIRNRALVMELLLRRGTSTRTELAELTHLTQASISKIIAELIEAGVVLEGQASSGKRGRRTIELHLNKDAHQVIAVKLSRRYCTAAVFDLGGNLIVSENFPTGSEQYTPYDVISGIKDSVNKLLCEYPRVKAIGVAVPGPYLVKEGRIAAMSQSVDWSKVNIREELESSFPIPVIIEHDTNASSFAEYVFGSTDKFREGGGTLISLLIGEGVGAGVIENGQILRGSNGVAAEVGHMSINIDGPRCICGNRGCLEMYCSSLAFADNVRKGLGKHPESSLHEEAKIDAAAVFRHMNRKDKYAREKVDEVGYYIGCGIANMVYLYNPDKIVITDIMTGGGDALLESIRRTDRDRVLPELYEKLTIRMTRLDPDPVLLGAASLASVELFSTPELLYK